MNFCLTAVTLPFTASVVNVINTRSGVLVVSIKIRTFVWVRGILYFNLVTNNFDSSTRRWNRMKFAFVWNICNELKLCFIAKTTFIFDFSICWRCWCILTVKIKIVVVLKRTKEDPEWITKTTDIHTSWKGWKNVENFRNDWGSW